MLKEQSNFDYPQNQESLLGYSGHIGPVIAVTPDAEWVSLSDERNPALQLARKRLAMAHAVFYRSVVQNLVSEGGIALKNDRVDLLIQTLPPIVRENYVAASKVVSSELQVNRLFLDIAGEDKARFLLRQRMNYLGMNAPAVSAVLSEIDSAEYLEPTPGLPIVKTDRRLHRMLSAFGVVGRNSIGSFLHMQQNYHPSFIIYDANGENPRSTIEHEASHFVFWAASKDGTVPFPNERIIKMSTAFHSFRDELCAFLVSGVEIGNRPTWHFVQDDDLEIRARGDSSLEFVKRCVSESKRNGMDPGIYLLAAMTSRNFSELIDKFSRITEWSDVIGRS